MVAVQSKSNGASDYSVLASFREGLYGCFGNGKDALMNLADALLTSSGRRSFAELSLSAAFTRRWSSLYEVFDDAAIDRDKLQQLFINAAVEHGAGHRMVLAADATPIVRAESPTARDRTYVHVPNAPKGAKPVAPGWQFATVVALPEKPCSQTTILDNRRIRSGETAVQVVAKQLSEIGPQLPGDAIVALDGGYGNASFVSATYGLSLGKLVRTAKNRTFYRPKPAPSGGRGRPRLNGDRFAIKDESTHGPADQTWNGTDEKGNSLQVDCWNNLHFDKCRAADLTLIRIRRQSGIDSKRNPRVIWLIWQGPEMPPLEEIPHTYRLRYCIEHSYRFDKQNMLWTEPRLRTPEKFETWTNIVAAAHNQITLACGYKQDFRMPWADQAAEPTPEQIRRGLEGIIAKLGTPARPTQPRGKAPGRQAGAVIKRAERYKTIVKQNSRSKSPAKPSSP